MVNSAVASSLADRLNDLGGITADRVRLTPAPGLATLEDLIRANAQGKPLCELIDQTLVEKAMGYEASVVAAAILEILRRFVSPRRLGLVSGADGMFQLLASSVRGPDVAFVSRQRLPGGKFPAAAYPAIAPDLAVEVLSSGNTKGEMSRKRIEYFHSGVRVVWMVDCIDRSVAVYTSPSAVRILSAGDTIDAGDVLPGFACSVADFFVDLDFGNE
jgi:Uma2 family endonuclease